MYLLLSLISGWFFSLPLVLFENIRPAKSLSISRQRTQSYRFKLIKWIACWVLIMLSLSALLSFLVIGVGRLVVPEMSGSLPLWTITIGIILLFWLLTNLVVNLLGTTSFAIMLFSACTNKPFFEKYHTIFMEYFLNFNSAPQKNHQFLRIA